MSQIVEIQSFPCVDYFKLLIKQSNTKIDSYDTFRKMTFRNRYVIAGGNGLINLSIPVAGGREQKTLITYVEIDDTINWRVKHWRSITSSYSRSPFFDYFKDEIKSMLFLEEKCLFNYNISILNKISNLLNLNVQLGFTDSFVSFGGAEDCRNTILPKTFQRAGESWQPKYSQIFEDRFNFQPNLSILDLLFCEGFNSKYLIEKSVQHI